MTTGPIAPAPTSLTELLGPVSAAMTRKVVTLTEDMALSQAIRLLEKARITGAPVVTDKIVVGIATVGDLMKPVHPTDPEMKTTGPFHRWENRLAEATRHNHLVVGDVMTPRPRCVHPDDPLVEAVRIMTEEGVSRLPVVNADKVLLGILTRANILWAIARAAL